jgi:glycolate oxidase
MTLIEPLGELSALVSEVTTDAAALAAARTDRSGWSASGTPLAVVRAHSVDDVQATLRYASRERIPVVTRGAATGLSGGAAAGAGAIALDLTGLDRIREIRPEDQLAVVEAGVITADLERAAAAHGLRYAPDPASAAISSIGGNIATNAGGLHCAKYGVTREAVLGLDVVLADGRLISVGRRTVKGVTGYDLTALFTGSEGTLGVIVAATLRLLPAPRETATVAAFFDSVEAAAAAVEAIVRSSVRPAVLELVDGPSLAAIDVVQGTDYSGRGSAFLVAQTDGYGAEAELAALRAVLEPLAGELESTSDPAEADRLLATRRLALPALESLGRVLVEDIAVPRSRLADAVAGIRRISAETAVRIFVVAHAGDGNLHPMLLMEGLGADDPIPAAVHDAAARMFRLALNLGGTLTAEHGVGVLKREWVGEELGADQLGLQEGIRRLFDPLGILNPGKAV